MIVEDREEDPIAIKMISSMDEEEPSVEDKQLDEQIQQGLVADNKTKAAKIIFVLCKVMNSSKAVIDYNYESLVRR